MLWLLVPFTLALAAFFVAFSMAAIAVCLWFVCPRHAVSILRKITILIDRRLENLRKYGV
jgi:hypothetical protein